MARRDDGNRRPPVNQDPPPRRNENVSSAGETRATRLRYDQYRIFLPPNYGQEIEATKYLSPVFQGSPMDFREIVAQQTFSSSSMDPINLYYSLGADKYHYNTTIERTEDLLGNYYAAPEDEELENLSYAPRGSYVVNWSYGGYSVRLIDRGGGRVEVGEQGQTLFGGRWSFGGQVRGLTEEQQARYFNSLSDQPDYSRASQNIFTANRNTLLFNDGHTYGFPTNNQTVGTFNMIESLNELWEGTNYGLDVEEAMRNFYTHLPNQIIILRGRNGIRTGVSHRVRTSPAAEAMINSVGLINSGDRRNLPENDYRYRTQVRPATLDERFFVTQNDNYRLNREQEVSLIRSVERSSRGIANPLDEAAIDRVIVERLLPGALVRPTTTIYDLYIHLLNRLIDVNEQGFDALREKLQTIFLSMIDDTLVRQETPIDPDQVPPTLSEISSGSFVEYEYYNFKTTVPFVRDARTTEVANLAGVPGRFQASIREGAFAQPNFNFYLRDYQRAISNDRISERALPNMYIYKLASSLREPDDTNADVLPPWEQENQNNANTEPGFDGQIRLQEFVDNGVPKLLDKPTDQLIDLFNNFGTGFGEGADQDVTFELSSERANRYYNNSVESGDIRIFEDFNYYKGSFPMYIEVGIPTTAPGAVATILGRDFTNATVTDALLSARSNENVLSSDVNLNLYTTEIAVVQGAEQARPFERAIKISRETTVVDFDSWLSSFEQIFSGIDDSLEGSQTNTIGLNRNNYGPGQDANELIPAIIEAVTAFIDIEADARKLDYRDLILGQKNECDTETIMYKLVKKKGNEIISNYYFPNVPSEQLPYGEKLVDILKFVDTQVKYGTEYQYEVFNIDVVYGSKFRFRRRFRELPTNLQGDSEQNRVFYSFNVETLPNLKIIEYPVITDAWMRGNSQSDLQRLGVSYGPARVVDFPPVAPDVNLFPYAGDPSKLMIALTPGSGDFTKENSARTIPFSREEILQNRDIRQYQRTYSYAPLKDGFLEYRGEGPEEIAKVLIYRTDEIDPDNPYQRFVGTLPYRTLSIEPDASFDESVTSFDFIDDLEPNRKYYYTFKSIDVNNQYSIPTQIYQVEMVSDKGLFIPEISIYEPAIKTGKKESKSMIRYLEVSAADIQKLPIQESAEDELPSFSSRSLVNGDRCIADSAGNRANKFVVRMTSKDTGKRIDLVVEFKINEEEE